MIEITGPFEGSGGWTFLLAVTDYIESYDAPVASYGVPERCTSAIQWAKMHLPDATVMDWPVMYDGKMMMKITIPDTSDAVMFKLMWVG